MTVRQLLACLVFVLLLAACNTPTPVASVPETPTPAASPTETPTPAPTDTPTLTATATASPTATFTPSPTATETPQPTPTTLATPTAGPNPIYSSLSPEGCTPWVTCIPASAPPSVALEHTENILLLGSDLRPELGGWNTDTMLLVALDRENKRVGVISFPRDYFLFIDEDYWSPQDRHYNRINVVDEVGETLLKHPEGGFGQLKDVFQHNFGIRIDHFARLHRQGFVDIVNALGGIEVDLACELWELSPTEGIPGGFDVGGAEFWVLYLPPGKNRLDGETALKFTTYRYNSLDYSRSARQQQFLLAAREQFLRAGTLTKIPELWTAFRHYFATDLGLRDLVRLGLFARDLDMKSVHMRVIDEALLEKPPVGGTASFKTSKGNAVIQAIEGLLDSPPAEIAPQPESGCAGRKPWQDAYLASLKPAAETTPSPTATPTP